MPSWRTLCSTAVAAALVLVVAVAAAMHANDAVRSAQALMVVSPTGSDAFVAASRIRDDIDPFDTIGFLVAFGAVVVIVGTVMTGVVKVFRPARSPDAQRGFEVIR